MRKDFISRQIFLHLWVNQTLRRGSPPRPKDVDRLASLETGREKAITEVSSLVPLPDNGPET